MFNLTAYHRGMAEKRTTMDRFNQGVALALGDLRSVERHRREIERSNTVQEAWVSVGEALRSVMTQTPRKSGS